MRSGRHHELERHGVFSNLQEIVFMNRVDRVSGLIMGAVIGDCLGMPYIFMKSSQLIKQSSQICWEVSDCGMSSRIMFDALRVIWNRGVQIDGLARAYRASIDKGYEIDCVFAERFGDGQKGASGHGGEYEDMGALCSNHLLIRQIPLVLAGIGWDRETLFRVVESECRLTHGDSESIECAQLYAYCLQGILQGKSRIELWDRLFEAVQSRRMNKVLLNSYYEKPCCDDADYSFASVAFGMAMYHFWHDIPIVSGLRGTILAGGATDINGAAVGAILGAWQGIRAIPGVWRESMLEAHGEGVLLKKALKHGVQICRRSGIGLERHVDMHWRSERRYASGHAGGQKSRSVALGA
jgi:ADP-ribosylglycohydrolase